MYSSFQEAEMKFKIKHESKIFHYGIIAPWIFAIAVVLILRFLGLTAKNESCKMFMIYMILICIAVEIVFTALCIIEKIFGVKIVIESDYIDIRMLLRHKRLYFNDIVDLRYSHYHDDEHANECHDSRSLGPRLRSQLIFTLVSGKCFKLNDNAKGYEAKRKLWITHPEIDPDEDIKLYQAYRCILSQYNK